MFVHIERDVMTSQPSAASNMMYDESDARAETFYVHMIKCPQMKRPQYNILKMGGGGAIRM